MDDLAVREVVTNKIALIPLAAHTSSRHNM
jgi:hypothetical protein